MNKYELISQKIIEILKPHVISLPALFDWMIRADALLQGSVIYKLWHDETVTNDNDIDIHLNKTPSDEIIKDINNIFIGQVSNTCPLTGEPLNLCNGFYIGNSIQIVWN